MTKPPRELGERVDDAGSVHFKQIPKQLRDCDCSGCYYNGYTGCRPRPAFTTMNYSGFRCLNWQASNWKADLDSDDRPL